ncbi:3-oxoacyl-(acyl-carrier-protein) synthase 3 protein 4 [Frankia canadensis]|uniref:3-oxoacyl-(Acyl-carrier-protein) synthase 3 protein 4 n=1 Tax=Frankia canadensis TaxID=1836972 RepID=A0A2I2KQ00_9ACTN|nr:beta-ketoacyl-ACP synthase 3 [Frankia canadensis]SNQ47734.1 3-oxoacyl-(acyl-carrier-protein) synthase 3 protein 4 [Frankia canadensis]SOU55024.1 3-oxoacyl-(acyl-carrier-protein) synthase 3 protein 4 [Frankia canadensis]
MVGSGVVPAGRKGARLSGLGAYRPSRSLTSEELGRRFGRSAEWIEIRTGFVSRWTAEKHETVAVMATAAAGEALLDSQLQAQDVDLVIVASCSNDPRAGGVAAQVAQSLGASRAGAMDLNAACAGFCYATAVAADAVRAGSARHVLVVASERMTDLVDPDDLGTSIIFGDGAGAVVVGPGDSSAIGPVAWGHDGEKASFIKIDETSKFLRMNGQAVFRWATSAVHPVARSACERAGIALDDLAAVIPHQANLRIVDQIAAKIGAGRAVVAREGVTSGNTSAASIPLALHSLRRRGAVGSGDHALLIGFGAGLSLAALVVQVP